MEHEYIHIFRKTENIEIDGRFQYAAMRYRQNQEIINRLHTTLDGQLDHKEMISHMCDNLKYSMGGYREVMFNLDPERASLETSSLRVPVRRQSALSAPHFYGVKNEDLTFSVEE